ncbi:polysaccharide deacetylase family protein [Actinomycetospora aeridis]|uniref:Polysaccharide deacetylase family protein n=1 Tax=Actinomycetospora aeridis TaxID=3129231 RepID=A0ABU8N6J2_9PSEU
MTVACYHSVDPDWDQELSVEPDAFARQCAVLARRRVVSLDAVEARLAAGAALPRRRVLLTFDDGFADNAVHAAPVLRRHGLPATFFIVAASLTPGGVDVDWVRGVPADEAPPLLDVDAVRALAAEGHTIANHSWSHRDLTQLSESECLTDLRDSRELLSDVLGRSVTTVAYPFGRHAAHVRRAAQRAGHTCAFGLPDRPEETGPFAVPRVGIYRGNNLATFRLKMSEPYLRVRTSRTLERALTTARGAAAR